MTLIRIFLLIAVIFLIVDSISAGPQMTVKQPAFNFGFVPQQSKITYPFWLYSTGDELLKIINVVPGWGCTKAPLGKTELAVGDSTKLEITFDTRNYRNRTIKRPKIQTNEGPIDQYLKIISDVLVNPDSTYPLIISPFKLNIASDNKKSSNEIKFQIKNISDISVSLSKVYVPESLYSVDLPLKIEPGKTFDASIKLTGDGLTSNFENSFTIEADIGSKYRFTIPVVKTK